ncbi:Transmembrane amino acid transporter protein [Tritrichomonas foetus]|uniref:Transmembrane amino acid transporter protein n=1 Tax=Tritrichomonas foetus TaxID=1144522 RepID=A0A1J4JRA9_9EUKA|nr:Transmembrane amino acid transporter protein [Tritrichomonas foetus]|eukprot:OHT00052.1 Transmembrane amino acid transporter protein [Tritrichomonas foetus]
MKNYLTIERKNTSIQKFFRSFYFNFIQENFNIMIFSSKKDKMQNINDAQLFPQLHNSIGTIPTILFLINTAIGTGIMKLGTAFKAGCILTIILNTIVVIISTYSFYLYLKVASITKSSTFESVWAKLFGEKTVVICGTISIISKFMAIRTYSGFCIDQLQLLIVTYYEDAPWWFVDRYVLLALITIIFYIPPLFSKSLTMVTIISSIKVVFLALLCILIIYRFFEHLSIDGFDPRNEIVYFRFDRNLLLCLDIFLNAYPVMPISFPGLKHFRHLTVNRFLSNYIITMIICWIVYNLIGLLCYFTFFELNTGDLILSYYPNDALNGISQFSLAIMIIFTIPVTLNHIRFVFIDLISKGAEYNSSVWIQSGFIILLLAYVISCIQGKISFWISTITSIRSPLVLFILPSIFYIRAFKNTNKTHFALSIIILILGIASMFFVLYIPFYE